MTREHKTAGVRLKSELKSLAFALRAVSNGARQAKHGTRHATKPGDRARETNRANRKTLRQKKRHHVKPTRDAPSD